jgi:threonine dehydratase
MATGVRQPRVDGAKSWGDGLMTGLGEPNFNLLRQHGVRIVTVDEGAIVEAARFFLQRMKIVVEPSAATVLAALRAIAPELRRKRIGMVLSGGNTDFGWLS